jgi:mannose-6-phosphate isomerase
MNRYSDIEEHFDNAGAGGFGTHLPETRSHNPYMHLLEAVLAAFQSTHDEFWLVQARRIRTLFTDRLLVTSNQHVVVFEFRNPDWTVGADGRVEIGHQLEWSTLLLELAAIDGPAGLNSLAHLLYRFAIHYGFENGLAIDAVNGEGGPLDRGKLLWSQLEAARHFSVRARIAKDAAAQSRADDQWRLIR